MLKDERRRKDRATIEIAFAAVASILITSCGSGGANPVVTGATNGDAEFAARWLTTTQDDAVKARAQMGVSGPVTLRLVVYFEVLPSAAGSDNDTPTIRQREDANGPEFSFKVRSDTPPNDQSAMPTCDDAKLKTENEVDVSMNTQGVHRRVWSTGCTSAQVVGATMPVAWVPKAQKRPCEITMTRTKVPFPTAERDPPKRKDLKIEEWVYGDGTRLVEVSWKAKDTDSNAKAFLEAIAPVLPNVGDIPPPSKEAVARACDKASLSGTKET